MARELALLLVVRVVSVGGIGIARLNNSLDSQARILLEWED